MRPKRFLLILLTLAWLSACGDAGKPATGGSRQGEGATGAWDAPPNYSFQVSSKCGEQNFIGTFHIVVRDGEVAEAKGLDESGTNSVESMGDEIPTLSDLLDYADEAQRAGADVVEVAYDENDGHPTKIEFDYNLNATDDESCFVINKYEV